MGTKVNVVGRDSSPSGGSGTLIGEIHVEGRRRGEMRAPSPTPRQADPCHRCVGYTRVWKGGSLRGVGQRSSSGVAPTYSPLKGERSLRNLHGQE